MKVPVIIAFDVGVYTRSVEWRTIFAGVAGEPVIAVGEVAVLVDGVFDGAVVVIEQSADGVGWSELARITARRVTDHIACEGLVRPRIDGGDILTALDVVILECRV